MQKEQEPAPLREADFWLLPRSADQGSNWSGPAHLLGLQPWMRGPS
jgi:hypothetical protein